MILEQGAHQALLQQKGKDHDLYTMQYRKELLQ